MKVRVMALLWFLASVSVDAGEGERKVFVKRWRSKTPRRRPGDLASLVDTGSRLQRSPVSCACAPLPTVPITLTGSSYCKHHNEADCAGSQLLMVHRRAEEQKGISVQQFSE